MKISLHKFTSRSRANGPGERTVIWTQGCSRRCPGCFNPGAQKFIDWKDITVDFLAVWIMAKKTAGITFSGGEPFEQAESLAKLARILHRRGLTVVCYTGYTIEELVAGCNDDWNDLLEQVDLLIDGPYVREMKCNEPYRGSANQRLHFLTGRIRPEEVYGEHQTAEFNLGADGTVLQTGFPELPGMDATMKEVTEILEKEDSE